MDERRQDYCNIRKSLCTFCLFYRIVEGRKIAVKRYSSRLNNEQHSDYQRR